MNNRFDFLRNIFSSDSNEIITLIYKSLSNEGLEVYIKKNDSFLLIANESDLENTDVLYISAADCDFAANLISDLGYTDGLLDYKINPNKDLFEIESQRYMKKRKLMYIEAAVIIVVGLIYFLFIK